MVHIQRLLYIHRRSRILRSLFPHHEQRPFRHVDSRRMPNVGELECEENTTQEEELDCRVHVLQLHPKVRILAGA